MTCDVCGGGVAAGAKYCSGACRQRAYRKRASEVMLASPRLDTFVGRATELADLTKLLARHRIVTVTGPPGVGKSRLVQEAVAHRRNVLVLELADVSRVADLVALGPKPALLVLDGCEHVREGCAALVQRYPSIRVLATSRELLGVPGEQGYQLDVLEPHDANRLFCDRAAAVESDFDETDELLDDVVTRLDRLPLAIELAARLVRVLSMEDIAARLDNRLALLTAGPRDAARHHRSLHAAIDHSYRLLSDHERAALRTFALLPGGIGPELAGALLPHGWEMAKSLAARSLLHGTERLAMLESVRLFAFEQLVAEDDSHAVRDRLVDVLAQHPCPQIEAENIRYAASLMPEDDRLALMVDTGVEEVEEIADGPLSWHEERLLRVAGMVAEGLTNRQIADGLHVSLRTVEADVRDLKTALGVRSRAQIAAWATQP